VKPEVVSTPVPTMLATMMNVAVHKPNSAGIASGFGNGDGAGVREGGTSPGAAVPDATSDIAVSDQSPGSRREPVPHRELKAR
jgi:hypothetical protein